MSKIFRLHTGAGENVEHWQEIPGHLSDNFINSIEDPSGSTAHTQITSIPSPFARMDLVRTAFRFVNSKRALDGTTIYHRMVSDCLDVAEIFFNIEALHDKIEILEWNSGIITNGGQLDIDANSELGKLLHSSNPKHKLLGETLKMFLFQDQKAFNFSDLKHCYLLNYKHGPELINIIGGTSPATLFFSSANDLSFVEILFANDKVFDSKYFPLYKRGREFIKFFYSFRAAFPLFSDKFPDLNTYLDLTFEVLDDKLKDTIRSLTPDVYQKDYIEIAVQAEGNNVEILGTKLRCKNYGIHLTGDDNDFILESSRSIEGLTPLVLPNEPFNEPLKYAGGTWQKTYHEQVPYADERPLKERTLPNQTHIKYPYLTVSDLLEPYLIRLPYPLDNEKFFNGNYEYRTSEKDHGFVLPIKKKFFEYFTIDDLQGTVTDGKKMFELQSLPAGVKAILRVPIKNNRYIQFTRLYSLNQFHDKIQKADEKENLGIITENQFTLAIYPFLKINPDINPHYRVLLVDRDVSPLTKHLHYSLSFYSENNPAKALQLQAPRLRTSKQHKNITTSYHIIESNFSFIEVSNNNGSGLLVPLFRSQPIAAKSFKFAIDFGTTNTHVEYKLGNEDARPLDITDKDVQVGTLHSPTEETETSLRKSGLGFGAEDLINIIKEEFLPFLINQSTQYKFPQRTVINDNGSFNPNEANFALADFNIPFWYLKEDLQLSSEITPNLKWIDFSNDLRLARRTKAFLKQLFLMIRNKVLLNGGDLAATEIVWFYPSSMPKFRRDFFQKSWEEYYHRYFPNAARLNKMSESFAPFYYYYHKENVRPHDRPAVSIDIGGGTTDIVIYQSENPIALTSFTFAANAIFGDGYGSTSAYNGFVQRYEPKILEALAGTSARQLTKIYEYLKRRNSSSVELIEFFFSLEDNKLIKDNKIPLSFSNMLSEDNDMKLVFIFFYGAIIYHVARLMKAKQLPVPEYITFSGNGSKVIKLAGGGSDLSSLLDYTRIIFEDVYGTKSPSIEFRFFRSPKEITCKGGLECTSYSRFEKLEKDIKTVLIGSDETQLIPPASVHYTQIENPEIVNAVCHEVTGFIEKFFSWNNKYNYYQNFGINPKGQQEYRELLNSKIKVDLISGIKEKLKETHDNVDIDIEETMFFYPIAGAINRLAYKIHSNAQVKTAMI